MKKLFLIPLMATALLFSVNLHAEVRTASTFAELKAAIDAANNGDEIQLLADIDYGTAGGANYLNITKSITLNGRGHTLTGACKRASADFWATLYVNEKAEDVAMMDIVIKDITLVNNKKTSAYGASIRFQHNINTVTLTNVVMDITGGVRSNSAPMFLGGSDTNNPTYTLNNCRLLGKNSDYPYYSWIKAHIVAKDTYFNGYCGMYFKDGSNGTVVDADNCNFDAPNEHNGTSNAFSCFACEDSGITLNLNNCGMNASQLGDQNQALVLASASTATAKRTDNIIVNISGDNSYFNCGGGMNKLVENDWYSAGGAFYFETYGDIVLTMTGGTYSTDPREIAWYGNWEDPETYNINVLTTSIPDGYEVIEMTTYQNGQETTLYRVRKVITNTTSLNDNSGENEDEEIKVTENVTLANEETIAEYVEVDGVTVTVPEGKTFEVTNGLDVINGGQVVAQPGSTVIVGEGGAIAEGVEGIVIESTDTKPASFLLDPEVIVNTTPNLTVKMIAKAGKEGEDWYWHRFAMPVNGITTWTKQNAAGEALTVPTYLQGWDYTNNEWASRTVGEMVPFLGYTLTYDQVNGVATTGETEVTYVFKGNLVGNLNKNLLFQAKGYNFFGNSYTAYIDAKTLLADVMNDPTIGGAIYMWDAANQSYEAVTMRDLREHPELLDDYMKEVAPMQTFILQLRSSDKPSVSIDYRSAIWGNPRYGKSGSTPAPARRAASDETYVKITLTGENGKTDAVRLTENAEFSAAYDNGADADKYMNGNRFNFYATVEGQDYSNVATDNIEGTMLSLQNVKGSKYTMSFSKVAGEVYAIKDMQTGIVTVMSEGNTYEFTAQENAVSANRFMIVGRNEAPTAVENAEMRASQKGVYTIMGQYLGETDTFNTLPAGIYVVDGVKVVR